MNLRSLFIYVLVFQLIVTSGLQFFTPTTAYADDSIIEQTQFTTEELKNSEPLFKHLYETLLGGHEANPLDTFSLLRQDFHKDNTTVTSISPRGVMFEVINEQSQVKQFRASESLSSNFDAKITSENTGFILYIEGKPVHTFRVPVESLAVVGNFIVFIEHNSYNAQENLRHLSFIDLNYFHLSKSELPIFKVPIHGQQTINSVVTGRDSLIINDTKYESGLFEFAASMQRIIFNVLVNTTSPEHLTRLMNYIEPYIDYFAANLEVAKKGSNSETQISQMQIAYDQQLRALKERQQKGEDVSEGTLKLLGDSFWEPLSKSMQSANENLQAQRGLVGRLGMLWQRLSVPRPAEVSSLKAKIVQLAVGIYKRTIKKADLYEVALELATNKKVRYSAATLSASAFAYYMPEASLHAVLSLVEMGRVLTESAVAKGSEFANIGWETTKATFSGISPIKLYETYIADGAWQRTSIGVSSMFTILTIVVGIPHILVNSYYLVKDFRNSPSLDWQKGRPGELLGFLLTFKHFSITENSKDLKAYKDNVLAKIIPNFIKRQQDIQSAYINALSDEKKSATASTDAQDIETENRLAQEFIDSFEKERQGRKTMLNRLTNSRIWNVLNDYVDINLPQVKHGIYSTQAAMSRFKNIENFAGAMSHFLFSFAAFTKSGVFYTTSWNYFFLLRALVFKPKLAVTFLFFPNYFRRSVATDLGKITPPSFWNGGTRWIWQEISQHFDRTKDKEYFEQARIFESEVVEVEKTANAEALKEAYKALQRYLKYKSSDVIKLSEQKEKLTSNAFKDLSYDAKSLFTVYYDKLIEVSMSVYLRRVAEAGSDTSITSTQADIKNWFIHEKISPQSTTIDIKEIVRDLASDPKLYEQAIEVVNRSNHFIEKQVSREKHRTYWNLDPSHSGQFSRFVNAEKQMKKPSAMARAVRANIVGLIVDKPMELALLFLLVAGITDGPNKPLWDTMFSQDSAFYLSRNVFMGYIAGLITSIFADVWVKVQRDVRLDSLGGFDQIPKGEMAEKPFRTWYWHVFRTDKNNKWFDQHKNDSKLIYHNMGPAFVLMTVIGMTTLGRVDIDFYTLGYITAFFLPFTGLSAKIEQTFDIASGWVLRHVPKNLHSNPLIIKWANKEITRLRMSFQVYNKLYENILGQFLGNLMALTTTMSGTRALSRILFGGKTVTERLIETTTAAAEHIPGAKFFDNACRVLFTNNYNSGKLPPAPK